MIAQITGILERVEEETVHLRVGGITYQILVPASILERLKARLRTSAEEEATFHNRNVIKVVMDQ